MESSVGIVGCGFVGESLALRLRDLGDEVCVWDASEALQSAATSSGLRVAESLTACVQDRDVVVLAAHADMLIAVGLDILPHVAPSTIVTDVGGVKSLVSSTLTRAYVAASRHFVGGHPIVDSPITGLRNAHASLFESCVWVLCDECPTITDLALRVGAARVVQREPRAHDRQVALIDHIPQLVVTAVAASLSSDEWGVVAHSPRLREALRASASPFDEWHAIVSANMPAIAEGIAMLTLFAETQEPGKGDVASLVSAMSTALVVVARDEDALELAGSGFRRATSAMDFTLPDFSRLARALKPLEDPGNLEALFEQANAAWGE